MKEDCHAWLAASLKKFLADINMVLGKEGANFCGEITSSDKRENISITKQPR